mmetsp:Transcript_4687/g.8358  ORF Transcript_4687/g.8358 Transcript_4687/m.8358 type:complete len:363 (-) Transcript_4687:1014-2102(-)
MHSCACACSAFETATSHGLHEDCAVIAGYRHPTNSKIHLRSNLNPCHTQRAPRSASPLQDLEELPLLQLPHHPGSLQVCLINTKRCFHLHCEDSSTWHEESDALIACYSRPSNNTVLDSTTLHAVNAYRWVSGRPTMNLQDLANVHASKLRPVLNHEIVGEHALPHNLVIHAADPCEVSSGDPNSTLNGSDVNRGEEIGTVSIVVRISSHKCSSSCSALAARRFTLSLALTCRNYCSLFCTGSFLSPFLGGILSIALWWRSSTVAAGLGCVSRARRCSTVTFCCACIWSCARSLLALLGSLLHSWRSTFGAWSLGFVFAIHICLLLYCFCCIRLRFCNSCGHVDILLFCGFFHCLGLINLHC